MCIYTYIHVQIHVRAENTKTETPGIFASRLQKSRFFLFSKRVYWRARGKKRISSASSVLLSVSHSPHTARIHKHTDCLAVCCVSEQISAFYLSKRAELYLITKRDKLPSFILRILAALWIISCKESIINNS